MTLFGAAVLLLALDAGVLAAIPWVD